MQIFLADASYKQKCIHLKNEINKMKQKYMLHFVWIIF